MIDFALVKSIVDLGCTVVVCALIVIVFYKLSMRFGERFMSSQEKIAEALAQQAQSLSGVNGAIQTYIQKDNTEHREILLGLQVVGENLKWLTDELRSSKKEQDNLADQCRRLTEEVKESRREKDDHR